MSQIRTDAADQRVTATFSPVEALAAIEAAQVRLDPASPLAGVTSAVGEPRPQGDPPAQMIEIVRALAAPSRQVRVVVPGLDQVLDASYYSGVGSEGLIGVSVLPDLIEITHPWSPADLAALTGATLFADPAPPPSDMSVVISTAGLLALAAAVDVIRQTTAEGLIARTIEIPDSYTVSMLQTATEVGMTTTDTRWSVTLLTLLSPPIDRLTPEALTAGIDELASIDLIERNGDSWNPSPEMRLLAAHWSTSLPAVACELINRGADDMQYRYQIAVRGNGPLYVLDWVSTDDGNRVHLHGSPPGEYLESLTNLFASGNP